MEENTSKNIEISSSIHPSGADFLFIASRKGKYQSKLDDEIESELRNIIQASKFLISKNGISFSRYSNQLIAELEFVDGNDVSLYSLMDALRSAYLDDGSAWKEADRDLYRKLIRKRPATVWFELIGTGLPRIGLIPSAQAYLDVYVDEVLPGPRRRMDQKYLFCLPTALSVAETEKVLNMFGVEEPTEPSTEHSPRNEEQPDFHPDRPIESLERDELGRVAVAETIAKNVNYVWADHEYHSRPFAIHLSGRWGSGKSSILNFLRKYLEADTSDTPVDNGVVRSDGEKGWLVIEYNAWQMQGSGPAWWTLRNTVVEAGKNALGGLKGKLFAFRDWRWKSWLAMRPWSVAAFLIFGLISIALLTRGDLVSETLEVKTVSIESLDDGTTVTTTQTAANPLKSPDTIFGTRTPTAFLLGFASFVAALGALLNFVRSFMQTSTQTAEAIQNLQSDPTEILKQRYAQIIEEIERPVAVFIDDLDRCDAPFVVEILQAIQTIYADVPVLYVVAADRDWIVSAYNQTYDGFKSELSKPGSPLGYLFVKKIFQLSINVPDLSSPDVDKLTKVLLNNADQEASEVEKDAQRKKFRAQIESAKGDLQALSAIAPEVHRSDVATELASDLLSAVISSKGQQAIRHALLDYVEFFDGNPRSIKRLINALTFRQGYILMAGQEVNFKTIALWTILDLRFPYTAAFLSRYPSKKVPDNRATGTADNPGPDSEFFHDAQIEKIIEGLSVEDIETVSRFG